MSEKLAASKSSEQKSRRNQWFPDIMVHVIKEALQNLKFIPRRAPTLQSCEAFSKTRDRTKEVLQRFLNVIIGLVIISLINTGFHLSTTDTGTFRIEYREDMVETKKITKEMAVTLGKVDTKTE